jgi:predicted ATPase
MPSPAGSGRLERTRREHAQAVFREWMERTDDWNEAARRAGVSERTGRRWRNLIESAQVPRAAAPAARGPQTSFIGRRRELEALHRLARPHRSVIAITGIGGIGKTRLALRYGELFEREHFSGGVYLAALSSARTSDDVCRVLAELLRLELDAGPQLGAALSARGRALLILDDLDGCAAVAAPLISSWAAAAPLLTILVTARARPGVVAETLFELESMPAEPDGAELFVERARGVRPDFTPADEQRARIAEVVRRLDGIPLAIELAAARVGLLGIAELEERLEARFELLTTAGRSQPSLLAELERSWQVLGAGDQRALAECALFRGGFTLRAAERVLTDDRAVDRLQTLRDHSLLRLTLAGAEGAEGVVRFDLYESIREFAGKKLVETWGEAAVEAMRDRHASCYLEGEPAAADLHNLRAVYEHAMAAQPASPRHATTAMRALLAMHPLLARTGPLGEYLLALDATLQQADAAALPQPLRLRAYAARGRVLRGLGRLDESDADTARSLELARALADRAAEGQARRDLGRLAHNRARPAEALAHYQAARALFAACDDVRAEAHMLSLLSDVANSQAQDAEARGCGERAIELFRRLGDADSRARALYVEGGLCFRSGRHEDARRCWEGAIALLGELGDTRFEGYARCNLGILLSELARYHSARLQLEAAHQLFARSGYQRLAAILIGYLGTLEHRLGNFELAQQRYREAIAGMAEAGGDYYAGVFHACRGSALAQLGRADEAAASLARAGELLGKSGESKALIAYELHCHLAALAGAPTPAVRERAAAALAALPAGSLISDDVRLARELLSRGASAPAQVAPPRRETWCVREDGTAVRGPEAQLIDLSARRPLARLLAALAQLRIDSPGAALSAEALFQRAWPGERVLPEARANRLNVALVTLRKLGLRPLLLRRAAGYLLDPEAAVELTPVTQTKSEQGWPPLADSTASP